ncbi:MAG: peptidoglycan-binding protein [Sulfurovum sp.]|nr:peptidoglycan-binding protein [Sulfurovum sp.]
MKIKILALAVLGASVLTTTSQASMLDQVVYNVVGQASNAAGARLGDEIYYGSSRGARRKKVRHRSKRSHRKRSAYVAPQMTDEKRIQNALTSLGFYKGKIDGQVNSFETRSAIKAMNIAYGMSNNASLAPQVKDTLIYLGTLFGFDRALIASGNDNRTKGRKIQTALKIHGFYHDKIDGAVGRGTRACIANYKREKLNTSGTALDFEEEYQLISTAKEMNDKNIEESIASLKPQGNAQSQTAPVQQAPVQKKMPALKAYQPVNNTQQVQAPTRQPAVATPQITTPQTPTQQSVKIVQ